MDRSFKHVRHAAPGRVWRALRYVPARARPETPRPDVPVFDLRIPHERVSHAALVGNEWFMVDVRLRTPDDLEPLFMEMLEQLNAQGWWLIAVNSTSFVWDGELIHDGFESWRGTLSLEHLAEDRMRLAFTASWVTP